MLRSVPGAAACWGTALVILTGCTASESRDNTEPTRSISPTLPVLPSAEPSLSPPAPQSTAASTPAPQDAALNAYRQMWAAMMQAASVPDPALPALARFASGEALSKLQYSLTVDRQNGFVTKGPLHIAPQVTSDSGGEVGIADCIDDAQALKYRADGSLKDDIPGGRHRVEATVAQIGGNWKVTDLHVRETGSC